MRRTVTGAESSLAEAAEALLIFCKSNSCGVGKGDRAQEISNLVRL
jgi:hypothetical protein